MASPLGPRCPTRFGCLGVPQPVVVGVRGEGLRSLLIGRSRCRTSRRCGQFGLLSPSGGPRDLSPVGASESCGWQEGRNE